MPLDICNYSLLIQDNYLNSFKYLDIFLAFSKSSKMGPWCWMFLHLGIQEMVFFGRCCEILSLIRKKLISTMNSESQILKETTHKIHVGYISLHLVCIYGKGRQIYSTIHGSCGIFFCCVAHVNFHLGGSPSASRCQRLVTKDVKRLSGRQCCIVGWGNADTFPTNILK